MFDAAARQQHDVGRRVAGDGVGDFLEFRQGPGQLEQDQGGALQQCGAQRELFEAGVDAQGLGVGAQRPFTGDEVLVDPDGVGPGHQGAGVQGPVRQGAEGQGTVPVPHHREPSAGLQQAGRVHLKGRVQQEPVRGVPGLQVGGLDIRESSQPGKEGFEVVVRHARCAAVSSQAWEFSWGVWNFGAALTV